MESLETCGLGVVVSIVSPNMVTSGMDDRMSNIEDQMPKKLSVPTSTAVLSFTAGLSLLVRLSLVALLSSTVLLSANSC